MEEKLELLNLTNKEITYLQDHLMQKSIYLIFKNKERKSLQVQQPVIISKYLLELLNKVVAEEKYLQDMMMELSVLQMQKMGHLFVTYNYLRFTQSS